MSAYIGPERRKGERRDPNLGTWLPTGSDRRTNERERRQEGLAGVISGLSARDMQVLTELWKAVQPAPVLTYDEIVARQDEQRSDFGAERAGR